MRPSALYPLRIRQSLRGHWDKLGPETLLLQCFHRDTPRLQERNTKKLYGTKNKSGYAQLGQILDKRDQNTQLPLLKSLEQKTECWDQKQGTAHTPCTTKGVGKSPKPPLQPKPWTQPYPHPIWSTSLCLLKKQASKGTCLFSLAQHRCFSRGPSKALPEFLVWALVKFYQSGKVKNTCPYPEFLVWPLVKFCQSGKVKNPCPYPEPVRLQNAGKSKHYQGIYT